MFSPTLDGRIATLLEDPLVTLMMRADGVDRQILARELSHVAHRLRQAEEGCLKLAAWLAGCGASIGTRDAGVCRR